MSSRKEKPSGLMNKVTISSPSLIVPPLPPPSQMPLVLTSVTEKFGMPGPYTPQSQDLGEMWRGVRGCLGAIFSTLSP